MIIDNIKNYAKYTGGNSFLAGAFKALSALDENSENRRYDIDADKAFINLSEYVNKNESECAFEVHGKYTDIQCVISGHEYIDVCAAEELNITDNRLDESDIAFCEAPQTFTRADLKPGDFVVLFPGEAHRPLVAPDGKGIKTKKAVVKIIL